MLSELAACILTSVSVQSVTCQSLEEEQQATTIDCGIVPCWFWAFVHAKAFCINFHKPVSFQAHFLHMALLLWLWFHNLCPASMLSNTNLIQVSFCSLLRTCYEIHTFIMLFFFLAKMELHFLVLCLQCLHSVFTIYLWDS